MRFDRDLAISYALRVGVSISMFFIIFGVLLIFIKNGGSGFTLAQIASYNPQLKVNSRYIYLGLIPEGLVHLDGIFFIATGLWVLVFTPITSVIIALISFLLTKNRLYIALSIIVLFNLFFAMLVIPHI
ncbi:DUF1634 domain-containing protein [Thermoplasma sp.]|uniref:DUF1634 domain-containing protein n=1 Tax=Thermoplasma sp. TaxID=1973142 RepID=UPI00261AF8E2|nr:DUF1634 domain-containing protein [Thermoplasma sp.]